MQKTRDTEEISVLDKEHLPKEKNPVGNIIHNGDRLNVFPLIGNNAIMSSPTAVI